MKFRVVIPLPPMGSEYVIEAPYPEAAKREAARLHQPKLSRYISVRDIARVASCFRIHSNSQGSGRHKSHWFEEILKDELSKGRDL